MCLKAICILGFVTLIASIFELIIKLFLISFPSGIPIEDKTQVMILFTRKHPKYFDKKESGNFKFTPILSIKLS